MSFFSFTTAILFFFLPFFKRKESMEVNTFYISFLRLVLSLRGGIGTGTFIEIMVLVGENRMRCQSQSVKLTLALHKGRMAFDSFFKGRVV